MQQVVIGIVCILSVQREWQRHRTLPRWRQAASFPIAGYSEGRRLQNSTNERPSCRYTEPKMPNEVRRGL